MIQRNILSFILFGVALGMLGGCASPESQAAAAATVIKANSMATADALNNSRLADSNAAAATSAAYQHFATVTAVAASNQGTQTAIANSAIATTAAISISVSATQAANLFQATATAKAQEFAVEATQTAVPFNAGIVETNSNNTKLRDSILSLAFLGGVIVVGLIALALAALIRREAGTLHRDASGQLPAYVQNGQVIDPGTAVVPVSGLSQEDWLTTLWRIYQWARTGKLPAPQTTQVGNDALTDPAQLIEAKRLAVMPTTAAATFQPGMNREERQERIEQVRLIGGITPLALTPPNTHVSEQPSDSVTQLVLAMIKPQGQLVQPIAPADWEVLPPSEETTGTESA